MAAVEQASHQYAERQSVEALQRVLSYLVSERQQMRARGATASELEANRLAIGAMQWQLSHALSERHAAAAKPSLAF